MKNIHVLPKDKPSRLSDCHDNKLHLDDVRYLRNYQNIYITSDEEIKEGDWFLPHKHINPHKLKGYNKISGDLESYNGLCYDISKCKRIILTTDQDLIKDGVQAIDDEFLGWFVENQSCEEIYVNKIESFDFEMDKYVYDYKIIIPKEETKLQCKDCNDNLTDCTCIEDTIDMKQTSGKETADYIDRHIVKAMVEVAKQKMYSEEEVEDLIYKVCGTVARLQGITLNGNHIDTAYKQIKKK